MTHAEANLANEVYRRQCATINGERFPLVWASEGGCLLVDAQDREFFACWHEITDWNWNK